MGKMPEELILLNEWKKALEINDWFVVLNTDCKKEDLELEYAAGEITYEEVSKSAVIRILSKEEYDGFRPFDFEEILVHELLHLKFAMLTQGNDWEGTLQLRVLHQLIDSIARVLVAMKRKEVITDGTT